MLFFSYNFSEEYQTTMGRGLLLMFMYSDAWKGYTKVYYVYNRGRHIMVKDDYVLSSLKI